MSLDVDKPITFKIVSEIMERIAGMIMKTKKIPQLVRIIHEPRKYQFTKIKRATSTSNSWDLDSPAIEIENPLDKTIMVKEISLVGNGAFKTNGIIKIFIEDVPIYESNEAANFTDISEDVVKFDNGKEIKQKRPVKVLIKNDDDSTSISVAVKVTFGD